jgi:hypothetical protein
VGDKVTVTDSDLDISKLIRITEITHPLCFPYEYSITVSDFTEGSFAQQMAYKVATVENAVSLAKISDPVRALRNWRTVDELYTMTFDPDGYFSNKIRPLSIETAALSVGAKSTNFALRGVIIKPNYTGDKSKCSFTWGYLDHFSFSESGVTSWTLQASDYTGLADGTAYYIYARCHREELANTNNTIILDTVQRQADSDETYYYFLVGILHSVVSGVRAVSISYGHTLINGGHITTGKIASANGQTYFDLDNNTLVIGSASGYENFSDKPSLGSLAGADMVSAAMLDETVIVGGYVKTSLLTADNIAAGTLTGRTVQTDSSGQRVVIEGAPSNKLKFFDTNGNLVILIDDDSNGYMVIGSVSDFLKLWNGAFTIGTSSNYVSTISSHAQTGDIFVVSGYPSGLASESVLVVKGNGVDVGSGSSDVDFQVLKGDLKLGSNVKGVYIGGNKVLGAQGAAVADASETVASVKTQLNALLARLRTHGIIAT